MAMVIQDIGTMEVAGSDPATLKELLAAGKKVPPEATTLLMQDHAEVEAMFRQFQAESKEMKAILAGKICKALTVHAEIEEATFYPEAGRAIEDDELISEAVEEHGEMKEQIAKIVEGMAAGKPIDRAVKTLMGIVKHHVAEEESEMFPDMRQADTLPYELGKQLAAQRVEGLLRLKREERSMPERI